MSNHLVVREWGRIVRAQHNAQNSFDEIEVNDQAWLFLSKIAQSSDKHHRYLSFVNSHTLKVRGFVGVIATPDGVQIEILPKHAPTLDAPGLVDSRKLLLRMLKAAKVLPFIESTDALIDTVKQPLPEVLMGRFLQDLAQVVRKGIRKDYQRIEAQERFLKGQLQTARQLRQSPAKQTQFCIEYDVFSDNRAENRLIHSALILVTKWSQYLPNQKLARELRFAFDDVPESRHIAQDLQAWRTSRDMQYYQNLLPWLKLILSQYSPFATANQHAGISFLLPMEKLFEAYVASEIQRALPSDYRLQTQSTQHYLATQTNRPIFQLRPDLVIYRDNELVAVLDTKWKLLDQNQPDGKAGIAQADMYQLFAYGQKCLPGKGRLILIYPQWTGFTQPLAPFEFSEHLTLDVIPFDLDNEQRNINNQAWLCHLLG
ncbi:restriction endonuclease [Thiomicrospira aerophila AL3]|uniref:Restriction endonuclease n=1 Tax=Thiomicrospira aerophila AL3 TaxID=717772 RepID=W0DT40_9GAMM|nr:McrC family protein [Thiomicrospira aerophila]AHF00443.1 restriction endonuclease [Thiomicrospira aerophila AL3]